MPFPACHPALLRALSERGYAEPTPVQAAVLADGTAGRDLLVSARTGSGKTVAFGLAIAPDLLGDAATMPRSPTPRGLVIAPTRELALQVQRELQWLYAPTGARIIACVGGMDVRREQRELALGASVVVGTPGRLRDHLERGALSLAGLTVVVLDEADEMLDLGFREELEALLTAAPAARRTVLFSATIPRPIAALARQFQRDALRIAADGEAEPHGDIEYRAMVVAPRERDLAVVNLLRWFESPGALVFCATREGVNHLANNLLERGFSVAPLSGELTQAERNRALAALRDGRARVCVATDVAARGLDLPDLGLVVHADLPRDRAMLLHRSGRTGRAGRKGVAVVLVPAPARAMAERLLAAAGLAATWSPPPSADDIRGRDQQRLGGEVAELAQEAGEEELAAARELAAAHDPALLAAALVRLHRARLPAPEELTVIAPRPAAKPRAERGASRAARDGAAPRREAAGPAPRRQREGGGGDSTWYRLSIGRINNADPRWLVPLICQRGDVRKDAIGAIRIGTRSTHVEIAPAAAAHFAAALARGAGVDRRNRGVRFDLVDGPGRAD